jgi:hypothetical protein
VCSSDYCSFVDGNIFFDGSPSLGNLWKQFLLSDGRTRSEIFQIARFLKFQNFHLLQQTFLGLSNSLMIVLIIAIYAVLFSYENVWKVKENDTVQQPQAVYNNLTVELSNDNDEDESNDRQMARTVKTITLLFVILWLPFFVAVSQSEETANYSLKKYAFLLAVLKSTLNPFLCLCINDEFRTFLMKLKFWS